MKTKTEFILPLTNQVIEILKEVQQFTGTGKYVFPSFRSEDRPMSDNTLLKDSLFIYIYPINSY